MPGGLLGVHPDSVWPGGRHGPDVHRKALHEQQIAHAHGKSLLDFANCIRIVKTRLSNLALNQVLVIYRSGIGFFNSNVA